MKKLLTGAAVAAAVLIGGTAMATTQTPPAVPAGKLAPVRQARAQQPLTRAAVQARVATIFAKLDTNHDGVITKDELNAVEAQREQKVNARASKFDPSKAFDRIDANHDGQITLAEVNAARAQRAQAKGLPAPQAKATAFTGLFARADTNKDNVLTRAEFDAMGQQLKARMERASVARGGTAVRMFDQSDANKDGRLTLAEMQQAALARFDRSDLNHDGTITPQERQQARSQLKAQRKAAQAPAKQ